jgi:hypothetical protein
MLTHAQKPIFLFLYSIDKFMYFTWEGLGGGSGRSGGGALFNILLKVIGYSLSTYISPQMPLLRANMCHYAFQ